MEIMIEYDLISTNNAFGFGQDWSLVLVKKGRPPKKYWLGRDYQVVSRLLGMRMNVAVEYYKKKANSENFEVIKHHIAGDILRKVLNTQRLTKEQLERAYSMNSWELAV